MSPQSQEMECAFERVAGLLLILCNLSGLSSLPLQATDAAEIGGCAGTTATVITADPGDYLTKLAALQPGEALQLAVGTYTEGLSLIGRNGTPDNCFIVEGPPGWPPTAVFPAIDGVNTVSIRDSSYLVIRNLRIDGTGSDQFFDSVDGIKAETSDVDPDADYAHHITIENLWIHDHNLEQGTVGISTKVPAWNWVIRNNVIQNCGTGLYLGNSNGEAEFVRGLVENNLVEDTIGYNMQIKHQNGRDEGIGMPADGTTIVRHNVFSKENNASTGGSARPNLLVGHWPLAGTGSDDDYLIYGNFFWQNGSDAEPLFQGEGNVIFYDNLMVIDLSGDAVAIRPHNDVPKRVRLFHNTIVAAATGIRVTGGDPAFDQRVVGNAVYAATTILGGDPPPTDNVEGSQAAAVADLNAPDLDPGAGLDLYPSDSDLQGPVDPAGITGWEDADRDFNGDLRLVSYRGAYAGEGENPGWILALDRKPAFAGLAIFADGFETGDVSRWSAAVP